VLASSLLSAHRIVARRSGSESENEISARFVLRTYPPLHCVHETINMRAVVILFLVFCAPLVLAQKICRGKMDYILTIIKVNEQLKPSVRELVENNSYGALRRYLEGRRGASDKQVYYYEHKDKISSGSHINLNVKLNADVAQNTYFSAIGVLLGRPDSFFGISMNLCTPAGNFTERLPARGAPDEWVLGYDAGFDSRTKLTEGPPAEENAARKGVRVEEREGLRSREKYATYALRRGNIDNYFPLSKMNTPHDLDSPHHPSHPSQLLYQPQFIPSVTPLHFKIKFNHHLKLDRLYLLYYFNSPRSPSLSQISPIFLV